MIIRNVIIGISRLLFFMIGADKTKIFRGIKCQHQMNKFKFELKVILLYISILFLFFSFNANLVAQSSSKSISWKQVLDQKPTWYKSEEAIRIANNVILYQSSNGGWPKNIDMAKDLTAEEVDAISKADYAQANTTIDNEATYTQMKYLARVYQQTGLKHLKDSFTAGLDFLLEAQYENGGWPQYYPIREGYYENITFNDGAMIGVMNILRDISEGKYSFVDSDREILARDAVDKGLDVILNTQIVVDGKRTAWCAQYHPTKLTAAGARTYELPSISGSESVGIIRYLMQIEEPSTEIVNSVNGAIQWLEQVKISGIRIIKKEDSNLPKGYDLIVGFDPKSSIAHWARFYEIDTFYPMFLDRDGITKYALSEIGYERRVGYRWLGTWANDLLKEEYPKWLKRWNIKPQ